MTVANPKYIIPRQPIVTDEQIAEWVKMFDPPTDSPDTPELLAPTNPVPEVMAAAGFQRLPATPHTVMRDLLKGLDIPTWDGLKVLKFFTVADEDNPVLANGTYPGGLIRIPRGAIFHGLTHAQGPPPHTIHWHGIEPTPINDGVGHCSMEIGTYLYQLQPNFIGTYFYHCHRNTPQHFEFGLFSMLPVETPDAYFASIASMNADGTVTLNSTPIGNGRPEPGFPLGRRRTAANLTGTPLAALQTADDLRPIDAPDPEANNPDLPAWVKFETDPHAMTVAYDVEAIWVPDDRDSVESDLAPGAFATFPKHGDQPGVNDQFHENGADKFFALNDYNPDYWFITGVPVPANRGGIATIPAGIVLPPELNSGISVSQVSINAKVGDTILLRCLDAAYNNLNVMLPVDVVIIAWDGRALGVPPFNQYNHAYLVPANTPIHFSVARRFDALIRSEVPVNDFATVEFLDTRNGTATGHEAIVLMTAKIPITIGAAPVVGSSISGTVTDRFGTPLAGVTMTLSGAADQTVTTNAGGSYSFAGLADGSYTITPSKAGLRFAPRRRKVIVKGADLTNRNFRGIAR